jgi:hypothetical protein
MVLLITYDLNSPGKNYNHLYDAIKSISGIWWHSLSSVWLVETLLTPKQVFELLSPCIDRNDEIFVIRLSKDYWGQLPKQESWDWLRDRVVF